MLRREKRTQGTCERRRMLAEGFAVVNERAFINGSIRFFHWRQSWKCPIANSLLHNLVTDKIDPTIDGKRDYVNDTVSSTGLVAARGHVTPPNALTTAKTPTGGGFHSDGRIVILVLKVKLPATDRALLRIYDKLGISRRVELVLYAVSGTDSAPMPTYE